MSLSTQEQNTSPISITVSRDKMQAMLTLDLSAGERIPAEKVFEQLSLNGITHGYDIERIRSICSAGKPCQDVLIAMGTQPVPGLDAEVHYYFDRPVFEPQLTEDDKANYYELGKIVLIKKGEPIAVKIPSSPGEPGLNVFGESLTPQPGRDARFQIGKGVEIVGINAVAAYDGALSWEGNKICVTKVYIVPGDVDFSVGNIKFSGKVLVKGSVKDGFTIDAEGDVEIQGIVENCEIISHTGSIFVKGGILGKGKARLQAARNIEAKFIQETAAEAGRHIIVNEYILRSNLAAGDSVLIQGFRGKILGENNITARSKIKANMVRSDKGVNLRVEGIDRQACFQRLKQLNEEYDEKDKLMRALAIKARLLSGKKDDATMSLIGETLSKYMAAVDELESLKEERQQLNYVLTSTKGDGMIEVRGQTDAGLFLRIKSDSIMLKKSLRNVTLYFDHEDRKIIMVGLS